MPPAIKTAPAAIKNAAPSSVAVAPFQRKYLKTKSLDNFNFRIK
jgi:hypothetical protein